MTIEQAKQSKHFIVGQFRQRVNVPSGVKFTAKTNLEGIATLDSSAGEPTEAIEGTIWDFQGVFDDWTKAVSACKSEAFFVVPVEMNAELPVEAIQLPTYWPFQDEWTGAQTEATA